ncbi:hypothetical protein GUJ93_ZPchr0013g36756 [Zizania palustris]|uniref:Uncharacterized protein n=1 Tax=Zizania palustris TaxID=103762 RepID=A0A8J6BUI2_ZIZPA|nr:hypothetical protein GUJ93_ZPchr0013g36756 [Zizania palustris]
MVSWTTGRARLCELCHSAPRLCRPQASVGQSCASGEHGGVVLECWTDGLLRAPIVHSSRVGRTPAWAAGLSVHASARAHRSARTPRLAVPCRAVRLPSSTAPTGPGQRGRHADCTVL